MKLELPISRLSIAVFLVSSVFNNVQAAPAPQATTIPIPKGPVRIPPPTGPYPVGTTTLILTDHNRLEALSPKPNTTSRVFVTQIFYPTHPVKKLGNKYPLSPYLTPGLARWTENAHHLPPHFVDPVITNSYVNAPIVLPPTAKKEVILFSPGYGASRSYYTTLNEELASQGYLVVAMEHLYDTEYVDIPGLGEFWNPLTNTTLPLDEQVGITQPVRIADSLFVLRSLADGKSQLVKGVEKLLAECDEDKERKGKGWWWSKDAKVTMYGHSLGGSTTLGTIIANKTPVKILGGVNLDGSFWGPTGRISSPPPPEYKTKTPFLMWGATGHGRVEDPSWGAVYNYTLKGWKRELSLENSKHLTFTDLSPLADFFGLRSLLPKEVVEEELGAIPGLRAMQVIRGVLDAFFGFVIRGDKGDKKLLDGDGKKMWPEVDYRF